MCARVCYFFITSRYLVINISKKPNNIDAIRTLSGKCTQADAHKPMHTTRTLGEFALSPRVTSRQAEALRARREGGHTYIARGTPLRHVLCSRHFVPIRGGKLRFPTRGFALALLKALRAHRGGKLRLPTWGFALLRRALLKTLSSGKAIAKAKAKSPFP